MKNKKLIIVVAALFVVAAAIFYFSGAGNIIEDILAMKAREDIHTRDEHKDAAEKHDNAAHKYHDGKELHADRDKTTDEDHEEAVALTESQMKEFGVEVDTTKPGAFKSYLGLTGEIRLNYDRVAHIVPLVDGVARKALKSVGDTVKAGEILAVLESKEIGMAKAEYLGSMSELETADMEKNIAASQVEIFKAAIDIAKSRQKIETANLERQRIIHANTNLLLKALKSEKNVGDIMEELSDKPIGENKTRLLKAYAEFKHAAATYDRELKLRGQKISSEAAYLEARKNYIAAKSGFQAVYEEAEFENSLSLLKQNQSFDMFVQTLKRTELELKAAAKLLKSREALLKMAFSNLAAKKSKLKMYGLRENDIERLSGGSGFKYITNYVIRAPFSGTVIERHIALGEITAENKDIFVIADLSLVWVDMNVYQKDLPLVKTGRKVTISIGHGVPDIEWVISWVSPIVNEETRTSAARVILPNKDGLLRPGTFVNGRLVLKRKKVAGLMIPKTAIQAVEGKKSVFVKTDKGFKPYPVITGREDGEHVEILSGLGYGQVYVKKGSFILKSELGKDMLSDDHNH